MTQFLAVTDNDSFTRVTNSKISNHLQTKLHAKGASDETVAVFNLLFIHFYK